MKKIILLTAVALALASCDNNDDNDNIVPSQEQVRISATIGEPSRAKDTSWSPGDSIGISSTVGTGVGPYTNVKYTTSGGEVFEGIPLYFYNEMTLIAYYPFTGSKDIAPGFIPARTDAEAQTMENQPKIDFLWDSRTNKDKKDFSAVNNTVNFKFAHKMSKLTFAFIGSEAVYENEVLIASEVKVSDIIKYEVEGLVMDGTFDTATGICATDTDAASENLIINVEKGSVEENQYLSPLIVFPQKPGNNSVKLHVYTDEIENSGVLQHYTCTLTFGDGELKPGNSYMYTVQVSKVGLKLGDMKIDDWNKEREVNLTATIDGGVTN